MTTAGVAEVVRAGWADHGEHADAVAERLAAVLHDVQAPADVRPYAGLVVHVYGEHLGRWDDGRVLLAALHASAAAQADAEARAAVARSIAVLAYAGGDAAALAPFDAGGRCAVLAGAAGALVGRGDVARGVAALRDALALAADGLPDEAPAIRSLAAAGNNIAVALEQLSGRSDDETEAMVAAAEAALANWRRAGGWLAEERAEYRLARSLLQAGRGRDATAPAERCLRLCERHAAPAFKRFFAHAVVAMAQHAAGDAAAGAAARTRALAAYASLDDEAERSACAADRAALDALDGAT